MMLVQRVRSPTLCLLILLCIFNAPAIYYLVRSEEDSGLVAWISFGKVGSSSKKRDVRTCVGLACPYSSAHSHSIAPVAAMRVLLARRAVGHGWQSWVHGRGWVGNGFDFGNHDLLICHAKSREGWLGNASIMPRCATAPGGYVVQTDYGYCERISRPCHYFTILREPISRVVSAYNYFCLSCAEGGSQCAEDASGSVFNAQLARDEYGIAIEPPQRACPNMSIADYASWVGPNYYVGRLSASQLANYEIELEGHPSTREDLERAIARLRSPDMLVLFTEELSSVAMSELSEYLGEESPLQLPLDENVHHHQMSPSESELEQLRRVLSLDITLYRMAWNDSHSGGHHDSRSLFQIPYQPMIQKKRALTWNDGFSISL